MGYKCMFAPSLYSFSFLGRTFPSASMYLMINRFSYTCPDFLDTTGVSGVCPETAGVIVIIASSHHCDNKMSEQRRNDHDDDDDEEEYEEEEEEEEQWAKQVEQEQQEQKRQQQQQNPRLTLLTSWPTQDKRELHRGSTHGYSRAKSLRTLYKITAAEGTSASYLISSSGQHNTTQHNKARRYISQGVDRQRVQA